VIQPTFRSTSSFTDLKMPDRLCKRPRDPAQLGPGANSILVRIGRGAETKAVEAILRVLKKTP
jgi:hypothetical protein